MSLGSPENVKRRSGTRYLFTPLPRGSETSRLSPGRTRGWPVSLGRALPCPCSLCPGGLPRPSVPLLALGVVLHTSGLPVRAYMTNCSLPFPPLLSCFYIVLLFGKLPAPRRLMAITNQLSTDGTPAWLCSGNVGPHVDVLQCRCPRAE